MLGFHQDEERSIEAKAQIWKKLLHEEASEKRDYDAAVLAVKWGGAPSQVCYHYVVSKD